MGKNNETWLSREQIVHKLRDLTPIVDSGGIFKTVLNADDEKALDGICTHLVERGRARCRLTSG